MLAYDLWWLSDRESVTVEAWLRARPENEVSGRDRNGGYGGAVAQVLPEAVQVADRWHLLVNASAAVLAAVQRSMPAIRKAIGVKTLDPKFLTAAEKVQLGVFNGISRPTARFAGWPMMELPFDG